MQFLPGLLQGSVEPLDLPRNRFVRNDAMANVRDLPAKKVDWSVHDPR
jgi:hypothetical protein